MAFVEQPGSDRRAELIGCPDIVPLSWAAQRLGVCQKTAVRLANRGELPGAFRIGKSWRVSVPRFMALIHGTTEEAS